MSDNAQDEIKAAARRQREDAERQERDRRELDEQTHKLQTVANQLSGTAQKLAHAGKGLAASLDDAERERDKWQKLPPPRPRVDARQLLATSAATSAATVALCLLAFWFFDPATGTATATGTANTATASTPQEEAEQWEAHHIDPTVSAFDLSERQVWDQRCADLRDTDRSAETWQNLCVAMLENQWRDDHPNQ